MKESNSWDWSKVSDTDYWMSPADESYFYAEKWSREGRHRILDLGCGLGRHAILFQRYGFDVSAIDSSKQAIESLQEYCRDHAIEMDCRVMNMHDLLYDDGSFDCIFAYLSVSHTDTEGIAKIVSEMRRVLVLGGALFFTLCSKDTWSFINGTLRKDQNTIIKTKGPEKGLPHFYVDQSDISRILEEFELVRVRHIDDCYFQGEWRNSKHYFIEAIRI